MSVQLAAAESTDLFVGTEDAPRQVLRATLSRTLVEPVPLRVYGDGVRGEAVVPAGVGVVVVEVGLELPDVPPGSTVPVTVRVADATLDTTVTVERPGVTVYLVSHVHHDPVTRNASMGEHAPPGGSAASGTGVEPAGRVRLDVPRRSGGFALVDAHLDRALDDPDYRFVLAHTDDLKPYLDTHPWRKADLRQLLAEGRVELVGGAYTQPNTTLTSTETTIRNLVYGIGYQRDVLGGEPATAWQLDVFGHDPQLPAYLTAAGLTGNALARGPYHQWGPVQRNFGAARADAGAMQFPSEFEWIAPSGRGILTHYMPNHYSAGWWMESARTLEEAELAVYAMYRILKPVAATRHLLLPVGTDDGPPNRWVSAVQRSWNAKYVWPRFVCGTLRNFFDGVRTELYATGRRPSPQTRDMNPVYAGTNVSSIDVKQAQRAVEVAATDAEKLATLAAVLGLGRFPDAAMDKVWRQLAYGSHQDAVTASDQGHVDLLGGWREAYDLATAVRDTALDAIVDHLDVGGRPSEDGKGDGGKDGELAVVVANTLAYDRAEVVRVPGCPPGRLVDDTGRRVPAVVDRGALCFRADAVPAFGWRTYRLSPGPAPPAWARARTPADDDCTISNETYRVTADPRRGGGLTHVVDRRRGRELLRGVGNELVLYEEYATHPDLGEGARHLLPRGPGAGSAGQPATTWREVGRLGERLVARGEVGGLVYQQTVTLWYGVDRIDFRTRVIDHAGGDTLLRVRFPIDLPGALPVSGVAAAALGRGYALPDVDAAETPWTLDSSAHTWFGLGSTARVRLVHPHGHQLGDRALGVAEIVVGRYASAASARDLVVALGRAGVTATTSSAHWSRYGWLSVDSNLPDFRIVLGGPDENALARELLGRAPAEYAAEYDRQLSTTGRVLLWVPAAQPLPSVWRPNADLRDVRALPALLVVGPVDELVADLSDATVEVTGLAPPAEPLTDATVALLTYGLPGFAVDPTGTLHLSLMRSSTTWPTGAWVDQPRRTAPDGSAFQEQRWTHEFAYALVAGDGDWRALRLPARGQAYCTPPLVRLTSGRRDATGPGLAPTASTLRVHPPGVVRLTAFKPAGNPVASGRAAPSDPATGVTLRFLETVGTSCRVRVEDTLGLTDARRADLLERPGAPADPSFGSAGFDPAAFDLRAFDLAGFDLATVVARPAGSGERHRQGSDADGPVLGPTHERVQPVYARYWRHHKGVAPMGYLPVTVSLAPTVSSPTGRGPITFDVVLSSQLQDAVHEGTVSWRLPPGWCVEPDTWAYRLEPDGMAELRARVTPAPDAAAGTYVVGARTTWAGDLVEDVAEVVLGTADDTPAERAGQVGGRALALEVVERELVLRAGDRAELGVVLRNHARDEISGELQLVSPWGTWEAFPDVVRAFGVPAGERRLVSFPVVVPADAEPGYAWAVVKAMWFGHRAYGSTVRLTITPG